MTVEGGSDLACIYTNDIVFFFVFFEESRVRRFLEQLGFMGFALPMLRLELETYCLVTHRATHRPPVPRNHTLAGDHRTCIAQLALSWGDNGLI